MYFYKTSGLNLKKKKRQEVYYTFKKLSEAICKLHKTNKIYRFKKLSGAKKCVKKNLLYIF